MEAGIIDNYENIDQQMTSLNKIVTTNQADWYSIGR